MHISCSVLHLMISAETQNFVMHYFDGHIYMCIHFAVLVLDCLYCTGLHRSAHIVPCFAVQSTSLHSCWIYSTVFCKFPYITALHSNHFGQSRTDRSPCEGFEVAGSSVGVFAFHFSPLSHFFIGLFALFIAFSTPTQLHLVHTLDAANAYCDRLYPCLYSFSALH